MSNVNANVNGRGPSTKSESERVFSVDRNVTFRWNVRRMAEAEADIEDVDAEKVLAYRPFREWMALCDAERTNNQRKRDSATHSTKMYFVNVCCYDLLLSRVIASVPLCHAEQCLASL